METIIMGFRTYSLGKASYATDPCLCEWLHAVRGVRVRNRRLLQEQRGEREQRLVR